MVKAISGNGLKRRSFLSSVASVALLAPAFLRGQTLSIKSDLSSVLTGKVFSPADSVFSVLRERIWNGLVPKRHPDCIVKAANVEDVVKTIAYARRESLQVSVRCGGHNWYAASLRDGGILLDISALREVQIEADKNQALVMPAVNCGEFAHLTGKSGLAFPVAHCGAVPLSGFLLNGGWGWNAGQWGVACSRVEEMELVTAEGERLIANQGKNSDLFWAARGCGPGFFAVATSFRLKLANLPSHITMSNYFFPLESVGEVSEALDAIADDIPVNVELAMAVVSTPPGFKHSGSHIALVSAVAFVDSPQEAETALVFLHDSKLASLSFAEEKMRKTDFNELLESVNILFPPRARLLGENMWSDRALANFVPQFSKHVEQAPSPRSFFNMLILPKGRIALPDAAVSMCKQKIMLWYSIWESDDKDAENEKWMVEANKLLKDTVEGRYIGETDLHARPEQVKAAFSEENWQRLQSIRKQYDPDGMFRHFLGQKHA